VPASRAEPIMGLACHHQHSVLRRPFTLVEIHSVAERQQAAIQGRIADMHRRIRFVGGPWHNRIEATELVPRVAISNSTNPNQLAIYCLAEYKSPRFGTTYYQFVHRSLIKNKTAHVSTYRENLKRWKIDRRELEERLRKAVNA
jgi:hypothetical protein